MKDEESANEVGEKIKSSPNIKSEDVDLSFLSSASPSDSADSPESSQSADADGSISDEGVKFRAKDIKRKDHKEMFVRIEGAKKIAKKKEQETKKKDADLTKRLLHAAGEKKKVYKKIENDKKAAKHKAKSWIAQYKLKKAWKKTKTFRIIAAIVLIIVTIIGVTHAIMTGVVIPRRIAEEEAKRAAAEARLIEENRTDMLRIFDQLSEKHIDAEEIENIAHSISSEAIIIMDNENIGNIYINGTSEVIHFTLDGGKSLNFTYDEQIDEDILYITVTSDNTYRYYNGFEAVEYQTRDEAIGAHILFRTRDQ